VKTAELVKETSPNDEDIFVKGTHSHWRALKGKRRADLWPEKVEARIRIGLPAIRKVLVKDTGTDFPMFVQSIGETGRGQNIESEILPLTVAKGVGAVDKAGTDAAGDVGLDPPAGPDEDVPNAGGNAEITILRPPKNRLRHGEKIHLIVTAEPAVGVAVDTPAEPGGDKFRTDLVVVGVAEDAEEIGRLRGNLEMWNFEIVRLQNRVSRFRGRRRPRVDVRLKNQGGVKGKHGRKARWFHERAEAYLEFGQLQ
jgi:hypothetical protein